MTHVFPYYTSIYAAVLGFLAAFLTANVIVNRVRAKVDFGDGGVAALGQASAHTPTLPNIRRLRCCSSGWWKPSATRRWRSTASGLFCSSPAC